MTKTKYVPLNLKLLKGETMETDNVVFLEVIEWFDETGQELVRRIPETGSGEIKYGAQLIVRESQAAVFFYQGKPAGAFGPGRHTLKTANIPLLTKIASLPWGFVSPLRAEVYFANLKVFTNIGWGTRDPVAFRDSELGLVRLRAFGVFNFRVVQPVLLVNRLVGTQGVFSTANVGEYLNRVVVSRFNDYMGETLDTILNLPAKYDEMSTGLAERLKIDFKHFGLSLEHLYINSITPPPEVQQAIDDRSRMGVFKDMDKLMKMKAAMAMEKAAASDGCVASGMGVGVGMMLPAMFSQFMSGSEQKGGDAVRPVATCPECKNDIPAESKFCLHCGHQQVVMDKCLECGKNLTPHAKFCPRCGSPTDRRPEPKICGRCGSENIAGSVFCHQCGEKLPK